MFRANKKHMQSAIFTSVDQFSAKQQRRLKESWAGVFYREFFRSLEEEPFAVLYSDKPSRPNIPVNVLVSLEVLKAGFGWSDEEAHDAFVYNLQVRYALGYRDIREGEFDLRTIYNFRQRLSRHMQETGENLIEKALCPGSWTFEQVADEQVEAFQLKTGKLRMDSTQIASNIREMSRLQLLVEVLQRVHRMLREEDQEHYKKDFEPYLQGTSGQYVYRIKGEEVEDHLQPIGELSKILTRDVPAGKGAAGGLCPAAHLPDAGAGFPGAFHC
jgi:hypothetical protein